MEYLEPYVEYALSTWGPILIKVLVILVVFVFLDVVVVVVCR